MRDSPLPPWSGSVGERSGTEMRLEMCAFSLLPTADFIIQIRSRNHGSCRHLKFSISKFQFITSPSAPIGSLTRCDATNHTLMHMRRTGNQGP
ncbi:hypothetical protein H8959_007213 [Pygathrix nigripes]